MSENKFLLIFWGLPFPLYLILSIVLSAVGLGWWVFLLAAIYALHYLGLLYTRMMVEDALQPQINYLADRLDYYEGGGYYGDDPFLPDEDDYYDTQPLDEDDYYTTQFRAVEFRDGGPETSTPGECEDGSEPGEDTVQEPEPQGLEP